MTRGIIIGLYVVAVILMFLIWAAGRSVPNRISRAGDLLAHMMQTRATRFGLLAVWWWLGWHYLARP